MALETLLGFRSQDATENINARLSGLIPKGIVRGGLVVPEPASLQIRIKGATDEPWVMVAFSQDGMVVRERSEEHVLPVQAGISNVIVLRAKYLESQAPVAQFEVMTMGSYLTDPEQDSLVRLAAVTPATGATNVSPEDINMSFRDAIEGFTRRIVRAVVDTKEDLPAVSGFPATADINFIGNTFAEDTTITIEANSGPTVFQFVPPITFRLDSPALPGLSRINLSQKSIISLSQSGSSPYHALVLTSTPHGFVPGQTIRITDNTEARANTTWQIVGVDGPSSFRFAPSFSYSPLSGTGGSVVDITTPALVTARTAPGILHSLTTGTRITIENATDPTFNGALFIVQNVIDSQTFEYFQYEYPTRDSGNGTVTKADFTLPDSAIQIGESADQTAKNFEATFRASALAPDISIRAIGSSLQFEASVAGIDGNSYTLAKDEPGYTPSEYQIVLSGSTFRGGVDPVQGAGGTETVQPGDIYVVLYGEELGTLELWGYDGAIFRNLTSALTATLLDFHRRNLFINEKHLSENEKAALTGTIGVPSATNRYVTEEDTSVLTHDIAEALQGADSVAPSDSNRFLTEARVRGQRSNAEIPFSQNWVAIPFDPPPGLGDRYIVGESNVVTTENRVLQYFNVVRTDSLYSAGGPMEYSQQDFSPVRVSALYVSPTQTPTPTPPFIPSNELNSTLSNWSTWVDNRGIFPRLDALVLGLPQYLWVKLSATPDNGSATIIYSAAIKEKYRIPNEDMLASPQRLLPAEVADLVNKSKELRFNSGISVSGKIINFPDNLFSATNDQYFTLRRIVSDKMIQLTSAFSLDLATGTGTPGIVDSWSPVIPPANLWTIYLLVLTQNGKVQVVHISELEEYAGAVVYGTNLSNISLPSLAFDDGRWAFGSIGVQANGTGTALLNLLPTSLELYPYSSAAKQPWSPIVCGDGVNTFGHFSGSESFVRALDFALSGATIKLLRGTYIGYGIVNQDDITFEADSGAVLTNPGGIVLSITGNRFKGKSLRFDACNVAIDPQPGSSGFSLITPVFESGVITKLGAPINFTFSPSAVNVTLDTVTKSGHGLLDGASLSFSSTGTLPSGLNPSTTYYVVNSATNTFQVALTKGGTPEDITTQGSGQHTAGTGVCENSQLFYRPESTATWTVTDGTASEWLGDFNSADGIQRAHDAASAGDIILVYPGVYSLVTWTNSSIQLKGQGGGEVRIRGNSGSDTALTILGDYNQFDNIILENIGTGIDCSGDSTYNTFGNNVVFNNTLGLSNFVPMKLPVNQPARHYNYHPLISENPTCCVTVGDGINSWGDYNGSGAINQAITVESPGTKIRVKTGTYAPITINKDQMEIEGSAGNKSVIQATAGTHAQCVLVNGNYNRIRGLYLIATGNDSKKLPCRGFTVTGSYNLFEKIWWQNSGPDRIDPSRVYIVSSGYFNQFMPHTAAPTSYVSITVGDGIRSFGDSNGSGAITDALAKLPTVPQGGGLGTGGRIDNASGNQADFTDTEPTYPITFDIYSDIYRHLTITGAINPENNGTFQIIDRLATNKVRLQRQDALTWSGLSTETDLSWRFLAGSKIWVLPGTYTQFTIQPNINDLEMEAWGAGSDVIISGSISQSPLLYVKGSRCRVKGFRFSGGIPSTGIGIQVQGDDNTFENNRFDCAVSYKIESVDDGDSRDALRNRIYDSFEDPNKSVITVSTYPSRADFYGKDEVALQAAVDYADANPHIKMIKLGEGTWTLNSTVNVPAGLRIEGSGYKSRILGATATFAAFTLAGGGFQTFTNIRFSSLQYSLGGTAPSVYAYGNWYESAPVKPTVDILVPGATLHSAYLAGTTINTNSSMGDVVISGTESVQITCDGGLTVTNNILSNNNTSDNATGHNVVIGGADNAQTSSSNAVVIGGADNTTTSADGSVILGGRQNEVQNDYAVVMGSGGQSSADMDLAIGNAAAAVAPSASNNHFRISGDTSNIQVGRATNQSSVAGATNTLKLHTINANQQSNFIGFKALTTLISSTTYVWPNDGVIGEVLQTDGSGNLLWSTPSLSGFPSQAGHTGEYLTTDGSAASWAVVSALPSQGGNDGKFLTTNGSAASWAAVLPAQSGNTGKVLRTDGSNVSWDIEREVPSQIGHNGEFLTTDGSSTSWSVVSGVSDWLVKSANYSAVNLDKILADSSGGTFTISLPVATSPGYCVEIVDASGAWDLTFVTVDPGAEKIRGVSAVIDLDIKDADVKFIYFNAARGWDYYY